MNILPFGSSAPRSVEVPFGTYGMIAAGGISVASAAAGSSLRASGVGHSVGACLSWCSSERGLTCRLPLAAALLLRAAAPRVLVGDDLAAGDGGDARFAAESFFSALGDFGNLRAPIDRGPAAEAPNPARSDEAPFGDSSLPVLAVMGLACFFEWALAGALEAPPFLPEVATFFNPPPADSLACRGSGLPVGMVVGMVAADNEPLMGGAFASP
jgi:hypothetical protein